MIAKLDKMWYLIMYSIALFPVLPRGIESVLIIVLFLVSLVLFLANGSTPFSRKNIKTILVLNILPILYILGFLYSSQIEETFKFIIRILPIVAFSLIFGFLVRGKMKTQVLKVTLIVYITSLLISLISVHFRLYSSSNTLSDWEYRQVFESLTGVHGTYYSLWLGMGILILIYETLSRISDTLRITILLSTVVTLYFFYWQLKIGARLPLTITLILAMLLFLKNIKSVRVRIIIIVLPIFMGIFLLALRPNYIKRFEDISKYDFSLPEGDYHIKQSKITNEQIRNGIYFCSFRLIKENWLIGYGIGNVNDKLQECYKSNIKSNVYSIFKFNSHNQYINVLLSSGIFGLALFLISVLFPLFLAYSRLNYLFLSFSILLITSMLTENILSRHDGVLFYSFFTTIFIYLKEDSSN